MFFVWGYVPALVGSAGADGLKAAFGGCVPDRRARDWEAVPEPDELKAFGGGGRASSAGRGGATKKG